MSTHAFVFGKKNAVPFSEFMQQALYHPEQGYYRQNIIRQGAEGDYVTAPSISPLFARCIANNLAPLLEQYPHWSIAEIGPGRGDCAVDLMRSLEEKNIQPKAYLLIEQSEQMRTYQHQNIVMRLASSQEKFSWHAALPRSFCGIVIANEVLDALPVHLLFSDAQGDFSELWVTQTKSGLAFKHYPASDDLLTLFSSRNIPKYRNYRYELSSEIPRFLKALGTSMSSGVCLFFDYGYPRRQYYHPDRKLGTLTSFYAHQRTENSLLRPGQQDISVHVDFNCVAESAHQAGFQFCGYSNQERFLLASHLFDQLRQDEHRLNKLDYLSLRKSAHTLTSPSEMGELVKVIAFQKQLPDLQILGFNKGSQGL
tara:strand:- start:481 stop:1584 length:1104 start_codon:yes stop_codon:yes gene_type:complete